MLILMIFTVLGIFLIGLGIWIQKRAYGKHSVEVEAECIEVIHEDYKTRVSSSGYTYMPDTKRPVYKYWYNGQYYTSAPMLQSNRKGYRPEPGKCRIRINPDHPEKVYSSERKYAAIILILIGSLYLMMVLIMSIVLWKIGLLDLMRWF